MKSKHWITFFVTAVTVIPAVVKAQTANDIVVKVNQQTATIAPTMWGVFFEDINLGADGGIYAELIKNRSFEFTKPLMGWTIRGSKVAEGDLLVINDKAANQNNPRSLRVTVNNANKGDIGLVNEGFRAIGIKKDLRYDFSVLYKIHSGNIALHIGVMDSTGRILGATIVNPNDASAGWHKATGSFNANATELHAKFFIWFGGTGVVDFDIISLFPSDTWKGRPGGLRADMVQKLADLKPGFIRFPGGCIVEGYDLSQRYQWKKTIGPVENRQLLINRWNAEFAHRPAPDYFQTFGLGFYEYFQMAEDIGAEPLPILSCGMACQFNSAELVAMDELDPYVQDALDLIEFANGDSTSAWGKIRAAMGHSRPFNLKLLGVGNENWGPQYIERLQVFTKAIKSKYPGIKLVNSSGTDPDGARFNYLNTSLRSMNADIIDEHYYRKPEWFFANATRYDNYPKNGSKVFGGEYAAQSDHTVSISNHNNWLTALSEAAFMTGLERNADVVTMASYAPLFAHIDGWQWTPDLIWVDNLQSIGTTDYYVQQLFSLNKGTKEVSITINNESIAGKDSLYACAAIDENSSEIIIKVVNASAGTIQKNINLQGLKKAADKAIVYTLKSNDLLSANSFAEPQKIAPVQWQVDVKGKKILYTAPPYSFSVIRVKVTGAKAANGE